MTTSTETTKIKTINPATETILNEYDIVTKEQIHAIVKTSRSAYQNGKKT